MRGRIHAPAALYPRERPGNHCTGGWVGPGPVWTVAKILAPTGIRSPDRPARSQSLYGLSYPAHNITYTGTKRIACCSVGTVSRLQAGTSLFRKDRNRLLGSSRLLFNPLNPELNPICYLLALLGAHYFLHVSRIRVKLLTFRLLMSCIYGAPILDVSRSHTKTQHSR